MENNSENMQIKLDYIFPVHSKVLRDTWDGFDSMYGEFLQKTHPSQRENGGLYIYDIRKASIELHLGLKQESLFQENDLKIEFFQSFKAISNAVISKDYNRLPQWVSVSTISNFEKIIKHLPENAKNKFIISAPNNDPFRIEYTLAIDLLQGIPDCKEELQKESTETNIKKEVGMIWLLNNHNKDNADTVIISDIDLKSHKVTFKDVEDKKFCKHFNSNLNEDWQNIQFVVDVEVIYGAKKGISRYHILKVYREDCRLADRKPDNPSNS